MSDTLQDLTQLQMKFPVVRDAIEQWRKFIPLWRHVAWMACVIVLVACQALIRVDVQQMRTELARNAVSQRHAQLLHQRLDLEMDVRNQAGALEQRAQLLGLSDEVRLVWLREVQ